MFNLVVNSVWTKDEHLFAESALIGTVVASLLILAHFLALHFLNELLWAPEYILLKLYGSLGIFLMGVYWFLFLNPGLLLLPILFLFLGWSRTRPAAVQVCAVGLELLGAWVATLVILMTYVSNHMAGLLCAPVALPFAALLARWRRWPLGSMAIVLAGPLVVTARIMQGEGELDGFSRTWWTVPLTLIVAWLTARFSKVKPASPFRRLAGLWGLCAILFGLIFSSIFLLYNLTLRESPSIRFSGDYAYDLNIIGNPPQLVWTGDNKVQVLTNVYGESHGRYEIGKELNSPRRIWPSDFGGFYVQSYGFVWRWRPPVNGERISDKPEARIPTPGTYSSQPGDSPNAFAEDSIARKVVTISEWLSFYSVADFDTGIIYNSGQVTKAGYPYMSATLDPSDHVVYISSFFEDGGLYTLNLNAMSVSKKASELYVAKIIVDPDRNLLWGARPFTGEVIAIDKKSFLVRQRVAIGWLTRALVRHPKSGDFYTCSFLAGDLYRIDGKSLEKSQIGRCGRVCRNLVLDSNNNTLWVATLDGICRVPLSDPKL